MCGVNGCVPFDGGLTSLAGSLLRIGVGKSLTRMCLDQLNLLPSAGREIRGSLPDVK